MFTQFAKVLLFSVLASLVTVPAFAIEGCKTCMRVEVRQKLCACYDLQLGDVYPISCSQSCMGGWTKLEQTVTTENGDKCTTLPDTLVPSTIMAGGTSGFQAWWNNFVVATSGSGASGPANSYYIDKEGTTSCTPGTSYSTGTTSWGATYSVKTYTCTPTGQACSKTIYIYGTDGE